ncbi:MAG: hypothetical protein ACKOYN_08590 [Planctomycetota bacterium]
MKTRHLIALSLLLAAPSAFADAKGSGAPPKPTRVLEAAGHGVGGKAWIYEPSASLSSLHGIDQIPAPLVLLAPIDHEFYLLEDEIRGYTKPLRFAIPREVELSVDMGEWIEVEGGSLWRIDIAAEGAHSANLALTGLALAEGQRMTVSAPLMEGSTVGPIEGSGEFGDGTAFGLNMPSATTRIDWFVPTGQRVKALPFTGVRYFHAYRDIWGGMAAGGGEGGVAGNCHNQPSCFATWANESNGTTRLLFNGFLCSGQLTATTAADETPYVSTANHCISTTADANACQFNFFYRTPTCNAAVSAGVNVTGSDLSLTYLASDCTLLLVRPTLPANVFWVGWTNQNPALNTASTGIHHPGGAPQAISFGVKNASSFNCGSPTTNWNSLSWNNGITEGGSSGSAIYRDSDKKLYGVLTCGASSCQNTAADDGYGRWDVAVNTGGFGTMLAAGSDDNLEANDTCATARPTAAGTYSNLVVKRLDEDWYSFNVVPGGTLSVNMTFTHANGDVDVQVFGACGGAVLLDRAANTNNEVFTYTNATAGSTLLMRVYLGSDTRNNYSMTIGISNPAPSNDECFTANSVIGGSYAFSTVGATNSTPAVSGTCVASLTGDIWWNFTATCSGQATATTCGASFDSAIVVYSASGGCPTAATVPVACNNDGAGCGTASTVTWPVTSGSSYFIRVGSPTGGSGSGSLVLACAVVCPADQNGDSVVDGADLASLLAAWGSANPTADIDDDGIVGGADLASLLGSWGACN